MVCVIVFISRSSTTENKNYPIFLVFKSALVHLFSFCFVCLMSPTKQCTKCEIVVKKHVAYVFGSQQRVRLDITISGTVSVPCPRTIRG